MSLSAQDVDAVVKRANAAGFDSLAAYAVALEEQARWARDAPRWQYVLETFWAFDYERMLKKLSLFKSLDEAVAQAERERDGMVAT